MEELESFVKYLAAGNHTVLSVDCEWHGSNHMTGQLRSFQISWEPHKAAYIRFMDDKLNYVFEGGDYKAAGACLSKWLDIPAVRYIGHHISADLPWMHLWLGLKYHDKSLLDTSFARQVIDENGEYGLERIALEYTDEGRYDLDLLRWKKANPKKVTGGYGLIPDDIMIPYACLDVDVPMQAYPRMMMQLFSQQLQGYYFDIFNPFVTDWFATYAIQGLPMDTELMDELRTLYNWVYVKLGQKFKELVHEEAKRLLVNSLLVNHDDPAKVADLYGRLLNSLTDGSQVPMDEIPEPCRVFVEHFFGSRDFNHSSTDQMRRWLFDVRGFRPIKSTKQTDKGIPSMDWEMVEKMPEAVRATMMPSTDKETLTLLAEHDDSGLLSRLLDMKSVGNLVKAFLKEPTLDEETGEVTAEHGLHAWLCQDGRVHGMMSATETGRPRSWKPNCLNWPKFVHKRILAAVKEALYAGRDDGTLPGELESWLHKNYDNASQVPSIRSCVKAPPGWCFVESDYQTAEIRGLAFISGDTTLIRMMTEKDTQFAKLKGSDTYVRVAWQDYSDVPPENRTPDVLFKVMASGKVKQTVTEDDLDRDADGNLIYAPHDLHWSLVERLLGQPREYLDKSVHRDGMGKPGNFSSAYGASGRLLERKIEAETKRKPAPGTGDGLLKALADRQPIADAFLKMMEQIPSSDGVYRAASGRLRHFAMPDREVRHSMDNRTLGGISGSLGRQARNFPYQHAA